MKVLCLLRVSTDRQELESQKQEMQKFLISEGFNPSDIFYFESAGASARSLNKKYLDMLEQIKIYCQTYKTVAIWHMNRLGRVESKLIEMKEFFIKNHIQLLVMNPHFHLFENDVVNPAADMMFSIFAIMVKFDTEEQMQKMQRGKAYAKSLGKYIGGGVPFGFKIENGYAVVDESQASIIRHLYQMYVSGSSNVQMRDYLHNLGFPFLISSVKKMMKNEIYKTIIGDELWNNYLDFSSHRVVPKKNRNYNLCEQLIICPECGRHFYYHGNTYRCISNMNVLRNTNCACNCKINIGKKRIECMTVESAWFWFYQYTRENGTERVQELDRLISELPIKKNAVQSKLDSIQEKSERYADNYAEGLWSKSKRDAKLSELAQEKIRLENELKYINQNFTDFNQEKEKLNQNIFTLEDSDRIVNNLDKIELYNLVHQYISKIEIESLDEYDRIYMIFSKHYPDEVFRYRSVGVGRKYRLFFSRNGEWEDITDVMNYNIVY